MALGVVAGRCRAREDELARHAPIVDGPAHGVPHPRGALPLVEEARRLPVQQEAGIDRCPAFGLGVGVEQDFARGPLPGCRRLSTAFYAFEQDRSHCEELIAEKVVGDAG